MPDFPLVYWIVAGALAFYAITFPLGTLLINYIFGPDAEDKFAMIYGFPYNLVAWGLEIIRDTFLGVVCFPWRHRKLRFFEESFHWKPERWCTRLDSQDSVTGCLASLAGALQALFDRQTEINQVIKNHPSLLLKEKESLAAEIKSRKESFRLAQDRARALGFRVPPNVSDYQYRVEAEMFKRVIAARWKTTAEL